MQKTPHFFRISSRLGMYFPPIHSKVLNVGVEDGAEAVLSADFLSECSAKLGHEIPVIDFEFSLPEEIPVQDHYAEIAELSSELCDVILEEISVEDASSTQVCVGGDHSVSFASLLSVLGRFSAEEVGVVMLDTHADLNLKATSPTGNFHGMWLRPFFSRFDIPQIEALVPEKIPVENLMFIGNQELDPAEHDFISQKSIAVIDQQQIRQNAEEALKKIETLMKKVKHLHLSFDIDVFAQRLAPATGTPNTHGLKLNEVFPLLEILKKHPSFSLDLVEVNPRKEGAAQTIEVAQKILQAVL